MENASKALIIAGSLLIALAVISLLVYTFNNMGAVQSRKDEIQLQESITKFNKEYEAFNKRIMYGVDVISCINKAVSNNEKYVKGGKYASGNASGTEALVQVTIEGIESLNESIEIYHLNDDGTKERKYVGTLPQDVGNLKLSELYENFNDITFTSIEKKDTLSEIVNSNIELKIAKTNFSLLDSSGENFDESTISLYTLTQHANDMEIIISNFDENTYKDWTYIKWTTCFADFKKRKFTCSDIHYSETTGYIDSIVFKEKE